ncbi:hypothetical protein GGX14DRAFT_570410 [Mycena pura]|uniref:Uncharacterized protein n=1 Tax=Mycena pura TaxID=153505 RepID=A0AAD6V8Z4_9AGAR|nr:hypothetical protein GGX14DRAFT_570410 [Mycena pura]
MRFTTVIVGVFALLTTALANPVSKPAGVERFVPPNCPTPPCIPDGATSLHANELRVQTPLEDLCGTYRMHVYAAAAVQELSMCARSSVAVGQAPQRLQYSAFRLFRRGRSGNS